MELWREEKAWGLCYFPLKGTSKSGRFFSQFPSHSLKLEQWRLFQWQLPVFFPQQMEAAAALAKALGWFGAAPGQGTARVQRGCRRYCGWTKSTSQHLRNPGMIRFPCKCQQTFWFQPWFHLVVRFSIHSITCFFVSSFLLFRVSLVCMFGSLFFGVSRGSTWVLSEFSGAAATTRRAARRPPCPPWAAMQSAPPPRFLWRELLAIFDAFFFFFLGGGGGRAKNRKRSFSSVFSLVVQF